jgi:DNA-binding CsgD family transcriptional regulator
VTPSRGDEGGTASPRSRPELSPEPEPDALEAAVRDSRLSAVLFDVDRARIIAISRPARRELGLTGTDLETFDLVKSASDPDGVRELLAWIRRGTTTEWTWRSRLQFPDGTTYYADAIMRAVPGTPSHRRRCIAFYPPAPIPGSDRTPIVESFGDLTVGSVGPDGHIECVRSVAPGLGLAPRRISSTAPQIELHGEDAIRIEKVARQVLEDDVCVSTVARVRDAPGRWRAVRVTLERTVDVVPSPEDTRLSPKRTHAQFAQQRVVELEHYLRRIAQEVEAAGFTEATAIPDASSVPGLEDLSVRQREVVVRLFRGERVATIARDMFLSQSTVRNHLASIYRKLGVRSQSELLEALHSATERR